MYLKIPFAMISIQLVKCALEPHVLGGKETNINTYPHSVLLNIICKTSFICGGSILNQYLIVTAAHCLEDCQKKRNDLVMIKSGHEHSDFMSGTKMKDFECHRYYDDSTMANDICLVLSERPLGLGKAVKRVALLQSQPLNVKLASMAGWGVKNKQKQVSDVLLSTIQELQPPKVCNLLGDLPKGSFCAGPLKGMGAPDEGDSGSALVARNYIQLGLVSYKVERYSLVVYTNVSYHYSWIRNTAMTLYCKNKMRNIKIKLK